jgi:hypothetical protein
MVLFSALNSILAPFWANPILVKNTIAMIVAIFHKFYRYQVNVLFFKHKIFILFYSVLNYLLFLLRITNIRPNFILVLTVAFMTIPANLTPRLLKINGMTTG